MKTLFFTSIFFLVGLLSMAQETTWRDVPANELNGVAINDLQGRMRESMAYATRYGFGAGVPTFENGNQNGQIVYGTVLVPKKYVEFKDIPQSELGNVDLNNFQERVRQSMTWAANHGYSAGIPTFYHADHGRGVVCGTILFKPDAVTFRDIPQSRMEPINRDEAGTAGWVRSAVRYASKIGQVGAFPTFHQATYNDKGLVYGVVFFKK
ncbi:hypothetical protein P1X15_14085 [Runella sp. MFBS21]|uniref:hypothetical protein n=1 Tax=Runella sp. MFBS21 TaxID=3034018 RepID=UPI0023F7A1FA|nr:hypothetical protein [Runella sp. MFBS21]MDF7818740.1 hypothetical protein [Runella sp. MFBS21]